MCRPISLIVTEDKIFLPPENVWNHSHSFIMKENNIPDGLIGDKYLRLEVVPPEENVFRDKETNKKLVVNKKWEVVVDEDNIPKWYKNDLANQEDRAREASKKWFDNFPDNLLKGYREISGDNATIIAGNDSTLTGGYRSTLTGGNSSILTGGNYSTLTGGYRSTLTGGNSSTLTGGDCSTLTGGIDSILNSRNDSKLNAGSYSTLTGGDFSTLTAGEHSKLTAGDCSVLIAGEHSVLTARNRSVFCAGENSSFSSTYFDEKRIRTVTFYVGENGILPNKEYLIINDKIYDNETNEEVNTKNH